MGLFSRNKDAGATAVIDAPPLPTAAPSAVAPNPTPTPAPKPTGIFAKPAAGTPAPATEAPRVIFAHPESIAPAAPVMTAQQREQLIQYQQLKSRIHQKLVERLDVQNLRTLPADTVRQEVRILIRDLCSAEKSLINSADQERLMDDVMDETFGLGPLEMLLKDSSVSDILVNRFDKIYVERKGKLELSEVAFRDNAHLRQIIDRIVAMVGRRVDETSPMVDARLADGSRVNAIIPPLALDGCAMSIRRFGGKPLQAEDLIKHGAFPAEFMEFMSAAVRARCNVVISGGTGSGKTTLLNSLSRYIGVTERVITIEDAAELQLQQPHVVRLETRPSNIEGKGEVTQRDLVKNCLRMRPDRVIIGECRSGETLDMLQAMNTGHEGSMTTVHANTPRDALSRIEVMIAMAGYDIPTRALRQQTASAINIIIQAQRLAGGKRKVTKISEITGMEGELIQMHDLFSFEQTGVDEQGGAVGRFIGHGIRPKCVERIESRGIKLPPELFQRRVYEI
jgi:pilus assembly protein CpaF